MTLQLVKQRFHVSYLCTFALRFLSLIYYYRQSQFTLKSLAILLCDLPSDHGVVWACGLAEEEWVDSGDAVGSLRMRCFICCLTRRCSAVAAGVRLTETTRERKKDYKFKLRT